MGILQARTLEQVATPSSRGSSQPRDRTQVSCFAGRFFTAWATREAPGSLLIQTSLCSLTYITSQLLPRKPLSAHYAWFWSHQLSSAGQSFASQFLSSGPQNPTYSIVPCQNFLSPAFCATWNPQFLVSYVENLFLCSAQVLDDGILSPSLPRETPRRSPEALKMIGQWLKGNKEQQRVILAILRPAFFFISCSEVSSATVQKGVPEGQNEHLLPGSLASGWWTVSLYGTDWGKCQVKKHSNQQKTISAAGTSTLDNARSRTYRDFSWTGGKMTPIACMACRRNGINFCDLPGREEELDSRSWKTRMEAFATVFRSRCCLFWLSLRHGLPRDLSQI